MAIEEAVEQKAQDAVVKAVEAGGRLTLRVSKTLVGMLVNAGWKLTTSAGSAAVGAVRHHMDTGRVSERKLQSLGQDVHVTFELPDDSLQAVSKSLREAGVTYHAERIEGGGYYLHFQGKDKDHVEHAVRRAFERIGLTYDDESIQPRQTVPQQAEPTDPMADEARRSASTLMPSQTEAGSSPGFTMHFRTVEWDPQAQIIGENLNKMDIPFTRALGDDFQQSFTFKQAYAPAVKRFIDKYSAMVAHFHHDRVANYRDLEQAAANPNRRVPVRQDEPSRTTSPDAANTDKGPAPEPSRPMTNSEPARPAAKKPSPGKGKKTRADFLAELKQRTGEKVAAARQAPARTRNQSRKHNTR